MRANRSTSGLTGKASPLLLGSLGVLCFSVTFPATHAAEASFSPVVVGVGRAVPAAALAIILLAARRQPMIAPREAIARLLIVTACVGIGFGLLSAIALRHVSSVHGAVLTGLIPAATAGMAVLRAGERPRLAYWAVLALGLAVVTAFAVIQGGGRLRAADALLLVAIAVGGLGYAEGGALAREYGGWRVICWAVILALPVTLPVTIAAAVAEPARPVTAGAALGLAYVSLVSMCLGFFAWYQAMARGGVARIGRLQLAQPALTLLWSVLLLGEHVGVLSGTAAVAVIAVTAVGRNARVDRAAAGRQLEPSQATHSRSPAPPAPASLAAGQPTSDLPTAGQPLRGQAPATFIANTDPAAAVSSSRIRYVP